MNTYTFDDNDFELDYCPKDHYNTNPYYDPESWGLTPIGEIELAEPCYSFDTVVVWKRKDGKVFFAHDSGCSCPTPFESFNSYADMTEVTPQTINALRDMLNTDYARSHGAQDLLYSVRDALRK